MTPCIKKYYNYLGVIPGLQGLFKIRKFYQWDSH